MKPRQRIGSLVLVMALSAALVTQAQIGPIQKGVTIKRPTLIRIIKTKEELIAYVETLNVDLAKMNAHERAIFEGYEKLAETGKKLAEAAQSVAEHVGSGGNAQQQLLDATKQMQESQMSFNLLYLQLQNQMQNENRQFAMVSNIMKTKHDTVKNSIGNIR